VRKGIATVWRYADVENHFVKTQGFDDVFADVSAFVKNVQSTMVFTESQFFLAAHHARRFDATYLCATDFEPARQFGAKHGYRHFVAGLHIVGSANDLQRLPTINVDAA
jgi:hypothetical protein